MRRRFPIKDADGRLIAEHIRLDLPDGSKRMFWARPGHTDTGLGGLTPEHLPLYGAELVRGLGPLGRVIVTEGETSALAINRLGIPGVLAVGTVTGGSSCPGPSSVRVLLGHLTYLWPDADAVGAGHMARLAAVLRTAGHEPRLLVWADAGPKEDAADFVARGGTRADLLHLLATAEHDGPYIPSSDLLAPPPRPLTAYSRRTRRTGDDEEQRLRAKAQILDVVTAALGHPIQRTGRSLWWRCPFHNERTPSFKVDIREPFFACFGCGEKGDVFTFLAKTEGLTFRDAVAELAPPRLLGALAV